MDIRPIGMRCTREQWDTISHLFDSTWERRCLVFLSRETHIANNGAGEFKNLITLSAASIYGYGRDIFDEWDADVFLEYCGIKQPTTKPTKKSKTGPVFTSNAKVGDKVVKGGNCWSFTNTQNIDDSLYGILSRVGLTDVHVRWYKKDTNEEIPGCTMIFHATEDQHELSYYQENQKINSYEQNKQNPGSGSVIEVRRPIGTVTTGNRPGGQSLQGPRVRTAITVGHLGHKACIG